MQGVDGGLSAGQSLSVIGTVATALVVVGLVCTGPVGVACAIIGGEAGGITAVLGMFV